MGTKSVSPASAMVLVANQNPEEVSAVARQPVATGVRMIQWRRKPTIS